MTFNLSGSSDGSVRENKALPYCYAAYGLSIQSQIELPELEEGKGGGDATRSDLVISYSDVDGPMPPPDELRFVEFSENRLYFAWNGIGRFAVERDGNIRVDPLPGIEHGLLSLILLGPIMAALFQWCGYAVLHGSAAILSSGEAVAFVGDNGAGKSTLAGAFLKRGYAIAADDVIAIEHAGEGEFAVRAGFPTLKLSREALTDFAPLPGYSLPPVPANAAKLRFRHDLHVSMLSPLAHVFVVERGEQLSSVSCNLPERMAMLMRYAYALKFGQTLLTASADNAYFRQSARLAQHVPVSRLIVPQGHGNMMSAVDFITNLVDTLRN